MAEPSSDPLPFRAAPILPHELPEALEFARRAGAHGVYACNGLSLASTGVSTTGLAPGPREPGRVQLPDPDTQDIVLLHGADGIVGLCCFGGRGNVVAILEPDLAPAAVAQVLLDGPVDWRIALGPERPLAQVARRDLTAPIVFREQLYYAVERETAPNARGVPADGELRPAERRDTEALVRAALDLNQSDLHVAPWRVNKAWLRESVRERIRAGRTWVIGPVGKPRTKLDLGSVGPCGTVLEGVYTFPDGRGRGLASSLVAAVVTNELETGRPRVCLHVDARNRAARRCYEKAGMAVVDHCHLLLRG